MSVSSTINNATKKPSIEATRSPTSVVVSEGPSDHANTSSSGQLSTSTDISINPSNGNTYDSRNNSDVRSPTSVTMVCSSSTATLLPSAAAAVATPSAKTMVMPKPFFVMDWLEEINPKDLELARQMLNTPTKNKKGRQQQQNERSASTPIFGRNNNHPPVSSSSPPASSKNTQASPPSQQNKTRSSINLPTLNHKEEDSVCRQLYPSATPSTPSASVSTATKHHQPETPSSSATTSSMSISRATSADTSAASSVVTTNTTPSKQQTSTSTPKMSPFKKRSIAIGNGWNAKGLHKAKKGSWESALACWENALEIRTQVLGETHPDVANTCNNIGIALGKLGRYDAAIEILERALELRAKHYGTREHVEVAATLHNIGNVLHAAQDCAGAIQCFWDAKLLQEQLLGPHHVQVARACVAIANVYYEAQQYEDAREAYYDALQVFANAGLSEQHPEILAIQQDLHDIENICQARYRHQQRHQEQQYHHPVVAAHYPQQQINYRRSPHGQHRARMS